MSLTYSGYAHPFGNTNFLLDRFCCDLTAFGSVNVVNVFHNFLFYISPSRSS